MDFFRKCDIYVYIYWKILNGKLHFLCSGRLLAINYFRKKTSLKMFDRLLNTPLDNTFQGIAKRRQKSSMHDFTRDFGFVIKK